jgi:hypothetical protein
MTFERASNAPTNGLRTGFERCVFTPPITPTAFEAVRRGRTADGPAAQPTRHTSSFFSPLDRDNGRTLSSSRNSYGT